MTYVTPSTAKTAFNCPICGALAKQYWYSLGAHLLGEDQPLPMIFDSETHGDIDFDHIEEQDERNEYRRITKKLRAGCPVLSYAAGGTYCSYDLLNVSVSWCYNCKDASLWIHDELVFPRRGEAPPANPDLSEDVRRDYDEASSILDLSPRGASALLRLAIQKLCKELRLPGKDLNDTIGRLVAAGLDPKIQKALDAVRVIGNNAVHPGELDLQDDRATAVTLFQLLNFIAERLVSQPRHVEEVYASLPTKAREAIASRDA